MLEQEVNNALVEDIVRILSNPNLASQSVIAERWDDRAKRVCTKLNSATGPKKLLDQVCAAAATKESATWIDDTVPHVKTMLQALADAPEIQRRRVRYLNTEPGGYISDLVRTLRHYKTTVTGYHVVEIYGSLLAFKQALITALSADRKEPVDYSSIMISVRDLSDTPDYRTCQEKIEYYSSRPWLITPLPPMVVVSWTR